jgi:hypothetical protein
MLWKFNRFLPEKPCQTGTLAKTLLLPYGALFGPEWTNMLLDLCSPFQRVCRTCISYL